ncbi:MAG TPA: hypothetical protein VFB31_07550 [Pseudolabrys sp.]|nr:hypothetical protein [Pseudolabrys sp.]
MPHVPGAARFDIIARKWHALALRRLRFYDELYRSGRWTLYYPSRELFARHMLDVIKAAKIWARLAGDAPPPADDGDDFLFAA